eukprot:7933830-Alexandrium_andersonii.AAC.1
MYESIGEVGDEMRVTGKTDVDDQQANELLSAGFLSSSSSAFALSDNSMANFFKDEPHVDEALPTTPKPKGKGKAKAKAKTNAAKAWEPAEPIEKAKALMERLLSLSSEAERHTMRLQGNALADPTSKALGKFAETLKECYQDLKGK